MQKVSLTRVIAKDMIDFTLIFFATFILTLTVYLIFPGWNKVSLSFYFVEQNIELFFVNPSLLIWFLGFGFFVTISYFVLFLLLKKTTFGGSLVGLEIRDSKSFEPIRFYQACLVGIGAYIGVLAFFISPLSAWWLDRYHRGWSEKLARAQVIRK